MFNFRPSRTHGGPSSLIELGSAARTFPWRQRPDESKPIRVNTPSALRAADEQLRVDLTDKHRAETSEHGDVAGTRDDVHEQEGQGDECEGADLEGNVLGSHAHRRSLASAGPLSAFTRMPGNRSEAKHRWRPVSAIERPEVDYSSPSQRAIRSIKSETPSPMRAVLGPKINQALNTVSGINAAPASAKTKAIAIAPVP